MAKAEFTQESLVSKSPSLSLLLELRRLEDNNISDEQMEIIRLALEGLGIEQYRWNYDVLDGHQRPSRPRTLPELYDRLVTEVGDEEALFILHEALVGVGVEEELLRKVVSRANCDAKIADSIYMHEKYSDFSMLLALGNTVLSISKEEFKLYFKKMRYGPRSRLGDVAHLYHEHGGHFSEFLDTTLELKAKQYIDSHIKKRARAIFRRAMAEGYVSLINIKIIICGPPYVGKTAFKALLLNSKPPLKHNSTPIAARPVQAIEILADGDQVWKEVSDDDLLQMLSATVRKQPKVSPENYSTSTLAVGAIFKSLHRAVSIEESSLPDVPSSTHTNTLHEIAVAPHQPARDFASEKIVEQLASAKMRQEVPLKLHESTWIRLIDSGGQPQFIDLLHLFIRDNSLYIIVMKVTESLHDKPSFAYSLNGKPVSVPKELSLTNLQIIESFVRSATAASRHQMTNGKPSFAIVATNCDQSKFKRLVGLDENLKTKNKILQESLKDFLDLFIFYNRDSNKLIFPVNNLCQQNREKISNEIRHRLLSSQPDICLKVKIPIRWHIFDLNMKKEASNEPHGVISLESCYTLGNKLDMKKAEIYQCLIYLDSVRLCIYYPDIIPHAVFTNPQFLIDSLQYCESLIC